MTTLAELRSQFLDYFKSKQHKLVESSPLVPANDPTLLFTNAGMVQFKDTFLGLEKRPYLRAASSQRCVRAGGKHNDLENVGYTARHHTFFEMLGNFSFGDYFKEQAIEYAWEFLTKVIGLPASNLWITVYADDEEAADVWLNKIGVDPKQFSRIATKDNFWQMGDTGPCGPCSEIFYDHGPDITGGPPGTAEEDGDRYVEIWNLVFMQFNRQSDGKMEPLPKPSVDTGMGLERLAAVLQGVHSNYQVDLFQNLIAAAARAVGTDDLGSNSLQVIADHIRSCAFMVVDGVVPSNEGRGYVLRRIIRRAVRHGHQLGCKKLFFYKIVAALVEEMGAAYPELAAQQSNVENALRQEEERFAETLDQGMRILSEAIASLKGKTIAGDIAFKLYDTYGFPLDLTADIARERGLNIDMEAYEKAMQMQRERAQAGSQFSVDQSQRIELDASTEFTGYDHLQGESGLLHILHENEPVDSLQQGQQGILVLKETPFYAESGGQVGDQGQILSGVNAFNVLDTQKLADAILHIGEVTNGSFNRGDKVNAIVDADIRQATIANHSATHLLHAALRNVLGKHVQQKGSLVDENRLRFDFSHGTAMSSDELQQVEAIVNKEILANRAASAKTMSMDEAKKAGAMALFGEKYGDQVRVLSFGDFSIELCGGTHVNRTGDIGLMKIISETGIAAGVRRIEAITAQNALNWVADNDALLSRLSDSVKSNKEQLELRVQQMVVRNRELEKELQKLKGKLAGQSGLDLASKAIKVDGVNVLAQNLDGADVKTLREAMDQLKNKLGSAAIVLATVEDSKVRLVAGVTKDQTKRLHAGKLVNFVAEQVGGKGGGRPDMAQAGGTEPEKLNAALSQVAEWVQNQLS